MHLKIPQIVILLFCLAVKSKETKILVSIIILVVSFIHNIVANSDLNGILCVF